MTDIILSSFLSLFALFGKEEQVDETRAINMLVSYLRHHFGIRNINAYLDFYSDLRGVYEMSDDLDAMEVVASICDNLQGKIQAKEGVMLLLRMMEFCGVKGERLHPMFGMMAEKFNVTDEQLQDFVDYVNDRPSERVLLLHPEGFDGPLKTLLIPAWGTLIFTYNGTDRVLLNDVPVLSGAYQVWLQSSVLKGKKGIPVYYSSVMTEYERQKIKNDKDSHIEEQRVEFCGRNINFRFPNSDNGMHDLSFTLHSGELLAIMGGSGTGKSTLLSILNGSLTPQEGTITINGHDISEPKAKDLIGFVPQDDLLIEELTVYQNLYYTAKFCFATMTEEEIDRRVMKTLKDLGLDATKDLKVGSPINKFISGGQRKRLNIALELIREPAVLFLDEPTSGLSSADTEKVINLLKEQTYKGKLIVVNIHQPSSDVYKLFDRLWLLDRGGYPVFDGNPIDAITYFKEAANYADAETSACPTCGNVNPEIVLNIIDEKTISSTGESSDERKMTPQEWHELYLKKQPRLSEPQKSDIPSSDVLKPGKLKQLLIYLQRNLKTKITNVQYLCIALLEAPVLAVICALLTRYAPPEGYSVMNNKNLVSYFFMSVIVATFIGMSGSAEEIIKDRALLKREKFLQLSYGSYIWSKVIFMAGVSLVQTLLFIVIGNSIMGFSDLTPKSTTGNVPLIGNLIPSRWSYEALAVTAYTDNEYERPFFALDKARQESQFYNMAFLYELQSQLETLESEKTQGKTDERNKKGANHLDVIRTNLPVITEFCGMKPYQGDYSYTSLKEYMADAESILAKRGNEYTLKKDAMVSSLLKNEGKDAFLQKNADRLLFTSTWGYKVTEKLNYTANFVYNSQLASGWNYPTPSVEAGEEPTPKQWKDARILRSGFASPAYVTLGLGIAWVPNKWLTVNFAPLTGSTTVVGIEKLRKNLPI